MSRMMMARKRPPQCWSINILDSKNFSIFTDVGSQYPQDVGAAVSLACCSFQYMTPLGTLPALKWTCDANEGESVGSALAGC